MRGHEAENLFEKVALYYASLEKIFYVSLRDLGDLGASLICGEDNKTVIGYEPVNLLCIRECPKKKMDVAK
jgi:hypothetical protein